ncbi:hypothetical protein [Streptomyces sp. NPDC051218]|uniref:hypothetical protein n=1 Tax=Streptomyces sp. NPDC051218 TaxID=3365645 RepID=UPI00379F7D2A
MADPELAELSKRATQLRSLADHIDGLADSPHKYATITMKKWAGPHADSTRGELKNWQTKCHTVAEALREEARDCDKSVKEAKNPKSKA